MDKKSAHQILTSRTVIHDSGKYTVKVTSVNPFEDKHIVNFNLMTGYQANLAKEAFMAGNYEQSTGKGTSLSASQLPGMYVPSKGEIVDVEVGWITNKEDVDILVVTSIVARKAVKAQAFSLELEAVEEPEVVA